MTAMVFGWDPDVFEWDPDGFVLDLEPVEGILASFRPDLRHAAMDAIFALCSRSLQEFAYMAPDTGWLSQSREAQFLITSLRLADALIIYNIQVDWLGLGNEAGAHVILQNGCAIFRKEYGPGVGAPPAENASLFLIGPADPLHRRIGLGGAAAVAWTGSRVFREHLVPRPLGLIVGDDAGVLGDACFMAMAAAARCGDAERGLIWGPTRGAADVHLSAPAFVRVAGRWPERDPLEPILASVGSRTPATSRRLHQRCTPLAGA